MSGRALGLRAGRVVDSVRGWVSAMTKVKCPKCELVNAEGQTACARCGSPLPRVRVGLSPQQPPPSVPNPSDATPEMIQFRPGQIIATRYTVLHMIGRGGMGCIYRVRDNVLKEEVALKTLLPQFVRDKMVVERFFNEARIARGLSHPNIVRVHDIGMTGNIIYISMELLRGKSLRTMLEELPPGQRLPVATTLHIIDELCAALEYAHHRTIHRDIKPENVMVCADGSVKLMDFGISKLMETTRLTAPSIVMGTPFYMSPEQLRNSADVDARADIYSVGVLLYEVLTGNMPTGVPKPASQLTREVPPALDPIVAKCVDPDPASRYQTATELRTALRPIIALAGQASTTIATSPLLAVQPSPPSPARRKVVGFVLAALILAAAGIGLYEAEDRYRQTHTASPGQTVGPPDGALRPPSAVAESAAILKRLRDLYPQIQEKALGQINRNPAAGPVFADADKLWRETDAEPMRNSPAGIETARQALQSFVAVLEWSDGMRFIPPGTVTFGEAGKTRALTLDGFLIDETEVPNAKYVEFCSSADWESRVPRDIPDLPATNVTFYDAQAFAAWAGKQLPTEAQWMRAALGDRATGTAMTEPAASGGEQTYDSPSPIGSVPEDKTWSACWDMAGNVSEWTASLFAPLPYDPADGREDLSKVTFGTSLAVRGSNFVDQADTGVNTRFEVPFEHALPTIGFRCVKTLPATLGEIETKLIALLGSPESPPTPSQ